MNFLLTIAGLLICAALQARLPALGPIRIEFLPALVAYGALTLGRTGALSLALLAGFVQDGLSAAPFGITALAYGVTVLAVEFMREALDRELPPLQMATGALLAAGASVAACCFAGFSFGAVGKIVVLAIASAIITPLLFLVLDYTRYRMRAS